MRMLDLKKSVFELTEEYPELIEILADLGFLGVKNAIVRNTLGKMMTIPAGCKKQGKDLSEVIRTLRQKGFEISNEEV